MIVAIVKLNRLGMSVEFNTDDGPNCYRVRAWNNTWTRAVKFTAIDDWDLACNIDLALDNLLQFAKQEAGR